MSKDEQLKEAFKRGIEKGLTKTSQAQAIKKVPGAIEQAAKGIKDSVKGPMWLLEKLTGQRRKFREMLPRTSPDEMDALLQKERNDAAMAAMGPPLGMALGAAAL